MSSTAPRRSNLAKEGVTIFAISISSALFFVRLFLGEGGGGGGGEVAYPHAVVCVVQKCRRSGASMSF